MAEDFEISVGADADGAIKSLDALKKVLAGVATDLSEFDKGLGNAGQAAGAQQGMRRTLKTYNELSGTIQKVSKNFSDLKAVSDTSAQAVQSYSKVLDGLSSAMKRVESTSKEDYEGKSRTVKLYSDLIRLSGQYSTSQQAEARAASEVTAAELKAADAKDKKAQASGRAAEAAKGEGSAALSGLTAQAKAYDKLMASMKEAPVFEAPKTLVDEVKAYELAYREAEAAHNQHQRSRKQAFWDNIRAYGAELREAERVEAQQKRMADYAERDTRSRGHEAMQRYYREQREELQRILKLNRENTQETIRAQNAARLSTRNMAFPAMGQGAGTDALTLQRNMALLNGTYETTATSLARVQQLASGAGLSLQQMQRLAVIQPRTLASQERYNAAMAQFSEHAFENQFALGRLAGTYATIAASASALALGTGKVAASFEQAFADLKVSVGVHELGSEIEALEKQLISLSSQIPSTFEELTAIGSAGAQMGIAPEDLEQFTKVIAMFSTQSDVAAEQAGLLFGRIQNLAHIETADLERFASTVSKLGRDSAATESQILNVTQSIAATATEFGITEEKIVGLSTTLASLGVPPEWARGALQRTFAQVSRAADQGAASMEKYAAVMGMSGQATLELYQSDPTAFFIQLVSGIGQATEAGQSFTAIMDEMGVRNTRDVQLLQRLSANHELLGKWIGMSVEEYREGAYLQDNFNVVANTTINTLKRLWNEFRAFAATAGEGLLLPIVQKLAETFILLMNAVGPLINMVSPIAPVLAAIVAPMFAIRAATALATASMSAFSQLSRSNLNTFSNQAKALKNVATSFTANGIAQRAAAHEMDKATRSVAKMGVMLPLTERQHNSLKDATARTTNEMTRWGRAANAAGGAAASAMGAVSGFMRTLGGGLLLGGAVALIGTIVSKIVSAGNAAQEVQKKFDELTQGYADTAINAAGGANSLAEAIQADTKAFADAGYAANEANGVFQTLTNVYRDMGDGITRVDQVMVNADTGTRRLVGSYNTYGAALDDAHSKTVTLANGISVTSQYLDEETQALGANVKAWQEKAFLEMVQSISDEDMNAMRDAGINIVEVFSAGIEGGTPAVVESSKKAREAIEAELQQLELDMAFGNIDFDEYVQRLKPLMEQLRGTALPEGIFSKYENSLENAVTKSEIFNQHLDDTEDLLENIQDLGPFEGLIDPTTIKDAGDLASALESVYNEMFRIVDLEGALYESLEGLGEAIVENGGNFDIVTEEGRKNMAALKDVVASYAAIMAKDIEEGMNPAEAAANMQAAVQSVMNDLANMGVDTSQLEWLMAEVDAYVTTPKTLPVEADTSSAVNSVNDLTAGIGNTSTWFTVDANTAPAIAKLNQISGFMNSILGTMAAIGVGASAASWGIGAGVAPKRAAAVPKVSAPRLQMPTSSPSMGIGAQRAQQKAAEGAGKANQRAGNAAKKAQDDARKATERQNKELEAQQRYVNDLANYYKNLGSAIFAGVDAEGGTFKALQELGVSLSENGKQFNTFTEGGRANFAALSSAMSAFGNVLSLQVERGVLDSASAMSQFQQYASGLYSELLALGVPAAQLQGFFSALGANAAQGWNTNVQGVRQFAFILSDAHGAAMGLGDAISGLAGELQKAKKWADVLSDALNNVFDAMYGRQSARDKALSAIYDMRDGYQDALDTMEKLRNEQQKLNADLAGAQADANKARMEAAISAAYGETDRQQEYLAQAADADARVQEIQIDISGNDRDLQSLADYMGVLEGNEKEVIANRQAILDLQRAMLDSITAYAAAGASTEELNDYTEELRDEFVSTAMASGYSANAIQKYANVFDGYVNVVKSTPKTVLTTAEANVDPAKAALNTIPRFGNHLTTAQADVSQAVWSIQALPQRGNYHVYSYAEPSTYGATAGNLAGLGAGRTVPFSPYVTAASYNSARNLLLGLGAGITVPVRTVVSGIGAIYGRAMGGPIPYNIPGFAGGGQPGRIPGTPPRKRGVDNLLAVANRKNLIAVRSGEWIQPQESVDYYGEDTMKAMQNRTLPRDIAAFANGGVPSPAMRASGGSSSASSSSVVELSPTDRALLSDLREVKAVLMTNDRVIAESANRGNKQLTRRGSSGE